MPDFHSVIDALRACIGAVDAHDLDAVQEYATRLRDVARSVSVAEEQEQIASAPRCVECDEQETLDVNGICCWCAHPGERVDGVHHMRRDDMRIVGGIWTFVGRVAS